MVDVGNHGNISERALSKRSMFVRIPQVIHKYFRGSHTALSFANTYLRLVAEVSTDPDTGSEATADMESAPLLTPYVD
jgi:hypothetical protein